MVEPQRRKELPARGPTSDMMGVYTWALALLLHMAEGGIQIPEVEIQGMRALGGGRGALQEIWVFVGANLGLPSGTGTGITVRCSAREGADR